MMPCWLLMLQTMKLEPLEKPTKPQDALATYIHEAVQGKQTEGGQIVRCELGYKGPGPCTAAELAGHGLLGPWTLH